MKKTILLILLIFTIINSQAVFAQTKPQSQTEQEIKTMLCHKWKLTHMETQGERNSLPPDMGESYMLLKSDGTLIETDEGKDYQGKWAYDHKTMTLKTDDKDGVEKHKIIKITDTELIIKSKFDGMAMNMIMKRID